MLERACEFLGDADRPDGERSGVDLRRLIPLSALPDLIARRAGCKPSYWAIWRALDAGRFPIAARAFGRVFIAPATAEAMAEAFLFNQKL